MVKRYLDFIKEANEEEVEKPTGDSSKFSNLIEEIESMIKKTIEKSGGEEGSFKEKFLKNPTDVKIEGLINDSDVYEFYLKFRNDIDELLNDIKFFDERPSEMNSFGLYDYIVTGTNRAVLEALKMKQ
jgi:hypothetical protein